ncbi:MAG: DUF6116 family protein [Terriglobia bacterium]
MPSISSQRTSLVALLLKRLNLRFPRLFLILVALTLIDWVVPDFIPFVDEIGLALLTVLLGSWKDRRTVAYEIPNESRRESGPDTKTLER